MYADWLTEAGFHVDQAHNGLQALERALDSRPHVVVTDLNIPGIDGFELTRRLKHDARTRDVPVLAVTGYFIVMGTFLGKILRTNDGIVGF